MLACFVSLLAALPPGPQDPAALRRPQTPVAPLPYTAQDVIVPATEHTPQLAGTLTLPRGGRPAPAVLLVQGGSPFDRDGTLLGHKPLLVIADALTREGFVTLRLDDRGVGGSKGKKFDATLGELAQDVDAGVRFLRAQQDVRADRVGLLGHSGGGLLSAIVASRDRGVAFIVLLGCPARPMPLLIAAQMAADGDGTLASNELLGAAAAEVVRGAPTAPDVAERVQSRWRELMEPMAAPARADAERFIGSLARKLPFLLGNPFLRDVFGFDPEATLSALTCPVLAIWGEHDQGGKLPNASAWHLARILGQGGCADFCIVQLPRTNHFLQTCTTGGMDEVARSEETVSPALLRRLESWLGERW